MNIVTIILIYLVVYGVFRRDEIANNADVSNDDNASSFKYKASIIGNTEDSGRKNGVKIAVPLKYLSNFWRSLEMSLINGKVELALTWIEKCMLTVANAATFKITDAKLYVPIVTLSAENNVKLSKLLSDGFSRFIYWNKYKVIDNIVVQIVAQNEEKHIRSYLILIFKELKHYLFLLMIIQQVIIKFLLILIKNTLFQELK